MDFDIVLASASPRRRELLEEAKVDFRVFVHPVDESLEDDLLAQPEEAAKKLAERKAHGVVEALLADGYEGDLAVLGADTMVICDGKIFGKPQDESAAREMLQVLSGRSHEVLTGVSLWLVHAGKGDDIGLAYRTFVDRTIVHFRELAADQIDAYIATGDPFDKAGAYGIQSPECDFVESISGNLDTVIGLPVARLQQDFPDLFA